MKPQAPALLALVLFAGCGRPPASPALPANAGDSAETAAAPRPAARPSPAGLPTPSDGFLAVAVARHAVEVTAELDGELKNLNVAVGDRVEPGTRLGTIETREIAEQLASSRAAISA